MNSEEEYAAIETLTGSFLGGPDEKLTALYTKLAAKFREGYLYIEHQEPLSPSPYIIQHDGKIFFKRAYNLLKEFERLYRSKPLPPAFCCPQRIDKLLLEQQEAIVHAAQYSLSCIWGGPGTGKTYTAGWFVKLYLENNPDARIALTAPTGKAASNLLDSIKSACPSAKLEAKTLHALLGLKRFGTWQQKELLPYDLVIVDESSMIDLSMFVKLLSSLSQSTRILFLGDPNQLPPIEPGEPFVALVDAKVGRGLVTTKRQENDTIILLANAVKEGRVDDVFDLITPEPLESFTHVKQLYNSPKENADDFFAELLKTRILSPKRLGPYGTIHINQEIRDVAKKNSLLPIIITKNDYELDLTNGQVGILSQKVAHFEKTKIPEVLLPPYELAYCLSVHKSQGSEFSDVHLFLPEGSESFGRNMLYTAITRAKKSLTIYAKPETLKACITTQSRPSTTLLQLS